MTEKGFKYVHDAPFCVLLLLTTVHSHSEARVRAGAAKLQKYLKVKQQARLDGWFTKQPKEASSKKDAKIKPKGKPDPKAKGTKRKVRLKRLSLTQMLMHECFRETIKRRAVAPRRQRPKNRPQPKYLLYFSILVRVGPCFRCVETLYSYSSLFLILHAVEFSLRTWLQPFHTK